MVEKCEKHMLQRSSTSCRSNDDDADDDDDDDADDDADENDDESRTVLA